MSNSNFSKASIENYIKGVDTSKDQKAMNVDFATKVNTWIKNYFCNIPVDGQILPKRKARIFWPEGPMEFASRIVQKGNMLSFVNLNLSVDKDNFWHETVFGQLLLCAFWTFNDMFLQKLLTKIHSFSFNECLVLYKELDANFYPYRTIPIIRGGAYEWSRVKKLPFCIRANDMNDVFRCDHNNRLTIKLALKKRLIDFQKDRFKNISTPILEPVEINNPESSSIFEPFSDTEINRLPIIATKFMQMLNPKNGSAENTLDYIESKIKEANFPDNIFKTVEKTKSGGNKYKLNFEIAAMVHVFQTKGYFKSDYTFKDIYKAFGIATGNSSGKDYDYTYFVDEHHFKNFITQLNDLKIEKIDIQQ